MKARFAEFNIMHFFVYFNTTDSIIDGSWSIYSAITIAEAVGIFLRCVPLTKNELNKV